MNRLWKVMLCLAAFLPMSAVAQPVTLKLSFFASDAESNYAKAIKPWIDAVNADPSGAVKIEAYPPDQIDPGSEGRKSSNSRSGHWSDRKGTRHGAGSDAAERGG
jgi:TRAP-type C4-dicarboxylate transport system substrate-binding protein